MVLAKTFQGFFILLPVFPTPLLLPPCGGNSSKRGRASKRKEQDAATRSLFCKGNRSYDRKACSCGPVGLATPKWTWEVGDPGHPSCHTPCFLSTKWISFLSAGIVLKCNVETVRPGFTWVIADMATPFLFHIYYRIRADERQESEKSTGARRAGEGPPGGWVWSRGQLPTLHPPLLTSSSVLGLPTPTYPTGRIQRQPREAGKDQQVCGQEGKQPAWLSYIPLGSLFPELYPDW